MEVGRKNFSKFSLESLCKPTTFFCDFKKISEIRIRVLITLLRQITMRFFRRFIWKNQRTERNFVSRKSGG